MLKRSASPLSPFWKRGSFPLFQDALLWQAGLKTGGKPFLVKGCRPAAERHWLFAVKFGCTAGDICSE